MRISAGDSIRWGDQIFQVIVVRSLAAELLAEGGERLEVEIDELQRSGAPVESALVGCGPQGCEAADDSYRAVISAIDRIEKSGRGERTGTVAEEAQRLERELGRPVSVRTLGR